MEEANLNLGSGFNSNISGGHEICENLGGNVNLKQPEIGGSVNLNVGSGFNNNLSGVHEVGGNIGILI